MRYRPILAASLAVAFGVATAASAATILFDPDGPGPLSATTIDTFDLSPGNSITLGVTAASARGTNADILFQGNLQAATLGPTQQVKVANCSFGAHCIKFVAGLPGVLTSNNGTTLTFGFDPTGGTNFYNIYAHSTQAGNQLTGSGFTTGTLILSGTWLPGFSASFTATGTTGALDQFGANNYSGVNSVVGNGAFQGNIQITFASPSWFPGLNPNSTLFVASSKTALAYTQTNPSACFSATGALNSDCTQAGVSSVGTLNGVTGPNTMLETDASFTFQQVPEPATLALFGVGLLGCAGLRRRQRKMNA